MRELIVTVHSGISSDGFKTQVMEDGKTLEEKDWRYGRNCSWDKGFATKDAPYVTDALQEIIDRHGIESFDVKPGENVFAGKEMPQAKADEFRDDYCKDLVLPENDFAKAVESIPEDGQLMEQ